MEYLEFSGKIRFDLSNTSSKGSNYGLDEDVLEFNCKLQINLEENPIIKLSFVTKGGFHPVRYIERWIKEGLSPESIYELFEFNDSRVEEIKLANISPRQHLLTHKSDGRHWDILFNNAAICYKNQSKEKTYEFFLDKRANKIFDSAFYSMEASDDENAFIYKSETNYGTQYVKVGDYGITPLFNYYEGHSNEYKIEYFKEPYLRVLPPDSATPTEIVNFVRTYLLLLSYYCNIPIEFTNARITTEDKIYVIIKTISPSFETFSERFWFDFKNNPNEFVQAVNFEKVFNNHSLYSDIIPKLILGTVSKPKIKFLLYYSIIEALRTDHNKNNNISDEFVFDISNKEVNTLFREKINEIAKHITNENDRTNFTNKMQGNIKEFKLKNMKYQFSSLMKDIDCEKEYGFKFEDAMELRNEIFHGNKLSEDLEKKLKDITAQKLLKLVDRIIMDSLGVKRKP